MKKILGSSLVLLAFVVSMTGCLKDKEYGTIVTESKGIAFTQSQPFPAADSDPADSVSVVVGVTALATTQTNEDINITLEADQPAQEDLSVTITLNNTLIPSSGVDYTPLPAASYSIPATVIIPKGEVVGHVPITFPNSASLDPSTTYAIGLTITAVPTGVQIVANRKNIVVAFVVKNKYDGIYDVTGTFSDVTNAAFTGSYPKTYYLVTSGPQSVDVKMVLNGELVPAYNFLNAGAGTYFGSYGLTMSFDPVNDAINDLHNYYGDPTKLATFVGDPSLGTGAPLYQSANTRRAVIDPTGVNTWDNTTGTPVIKIKHFLYQPSVVAVGPRCSMNETWTYTGPR